jgi:(5-formylfuran-3-yl)methyl phosphate synthase
MINGFADSGPAFLASVTSPEEARLAVVSGASIIDCKDPSKGALGALGALQIAAIVDAVGGRVPVSATIGDLPSDPGVMVKAAARIAATGVDIVKAGFFGEADPRAAITALGAADLGPAKRVAVLMADRSPDLAIIADLARAGFIGVMLDTAGKAAGSLPDLMDEAALAAFIASARIHGMASGLAGSLRSHHIDALVALEPDIIGFRGALCAGDRTGTLEAHRVQSVRSRIDAAVRALHPDKRSVA